MTLLNSVSKLEGILDGDLEAVKYQSGSSFPKELDALMQSVLDFGNEHDRLYGPVKTIDGGLRKHSKMKVFIEEDMGIKLKATIKKHTGIIVTNIMSYLPTDTGSSMALFCWFNNIDELTSTVIANTEAIVDDDLNTSKRKKLKDILTINTNLDKAKGKILKSIRQFEVTLGIPVGLFTTKDYVHKGERYQATAAELTAGLLHEVGHVFAFVEYLGDLSYTGYYGNNPVRDIEARLKKDPQGTLKEAVELGCELSKSTPDPKLAKFMTSLTSILEGSIKAIAPGDDHIPDTADRLNYNFSFAIVVLLTLIRLLMSVSVIVTLQVWYPVVYLLSMWPGMSGTSRTAVHNQRRTMYERLADEYVSRHGRSKDLNNLLAKIISLANEVHWGISSPVFTSYLRDSMLMKITIGIINIPNNITNRVLGIVTRPTDIYESDYKRMRRNLSNMYSNLKDTSIPKEIRYKLVSDIEQMERDLSSRSSAFTRAFDQLIYRIVRSPGDVATAVPRLLIGDTNVEGDYFKLFEQLEELMSNKSFYHAEKVNKILS